MHPIQLIFSFFSNLFILGVLAADVYLVREWYLHKDTVGDERYALWCLLIAIGSSISLSFGKSILKVLLGRKGDDEPNRDRSTENQLLKRPEGHSIFLEFYGPQEAQPIIFIHGWSSDSTQWYYLKKHFSKNYRLILMDLPGCGKSTKKPNNEYAPERFAQDLDEVIKLAGRKKPIVLGHSIGGMTILNYCKLFNTQLTNKVAGLVLVQTTYTNPVNTALMSGLLKVLEKPVLTPMCYVMIALAPYYQIMNWLKYFNGSAHLNNHLTSFAQTETKGQLELNSYLGTIAPVGVSARGMLGMFKYDATDALKNIKVPVLILAGNRDILCKPEASEFMKSLIPHSTLVTLQPSGHMGALERNGEMIQAVETFVKETVAKQSFVTATL